MGIKLGHAGRESAEMCCNTAPIVNNLYCTLEKCLRVGLVVSIVTTIF